MKHASVSVDVSRRDKIVTISYTITDNADLSKVYKMKDTVTFTSLDDSVSMHVTGEQVDLSDIKLVDKTDESSGSGTGSETKAFGENTADKLSVEAGFSANSGNETISGDFDVQYTFTNKTKSTESNWFNFIIEVFDSNGGITDRADNYGWFYGTHLSDGSEHTWGDTDFRWEEFKESMKDASV